MPRYFFNVSDRHGTAEDVEGQELPDREDARIWAIGGARSIIAATVLDGEIDLSGAINVVDEAGKPVLHVRYADVVGMAAKSTMPAASQAASARHTRDEDRLAAADRRISEGERRVLRQRQVLAKITSSHNRALAARLLTQFEATLLQWKTHRELLAASLKA